MRTIIFGVAVAMGLGTTALAADRPVVKPFTPPPPGPQYILWLEGGYSHFNLPKVHAFDLAPFGSGAAFSSLAPVFLDIGDGWYGRGEAGVVLAQRFGLIDAISVAGGYRRGSADKAASGDLVALRYDGPAGTSALASRIGGDATAEQNFALFDIQLRLKHAPTAWPGLTINVEPFFSQAKNNVSATIARADGSGPFRRTARIEGDIFGIQGAIEGRRAWTDRITLRGRASLGAYHMNADGDFTGGSLANSFSTNFDGLRAGAEIGGDFALVQNWSLGATAGVDHWSKMPYARLTQQTTTSGPPVGIDTDSFTNFFVGARLTFVSGAR